MATSSEEPKALRSILESGGQVVGNIAGVALAVVTGPLLGTGAGVALGEAFARVGTEIHDRILAPRQRARAGGALSAAAARIGERLDAGDRLRSDAFFDLDAQGRRPADEVLEGTLVTAANAWEERKVAPLGRLYANLAFDVSTSKRWANYLLRVADSLTYTQLVLLAVIQEAQEPGGRYQRSLARLDAVPSTVRIPPDSTLYREVDGLSAVRLIGVRQKSGPPISPSDTWGNSAWTPSGLINAMPTQEGHSLHDLMQLEVLPREDLEEVLRGLTGDRDP